MRKVFAVLVLSPLLAHAEPAPPPTLSYAMPDAAHGDDEVTFTEYKPGDRLCRQADAAPLVVKSVAPARVRRDGLVNRTYTVEQGDGKTAEVFGGELTPLCFRADFDGDGKPDAATVGFDADGQIRVRIGSSSLALRAAGEGYLSRKGGNVEARLVDARKAGLPLLFLASRPEACSDYWESYVSGVGGTARLALETAGLSDPPSFSQPSVVFDARRKTAVVTQAELDENGEKVRKRTRTRYRLRDGVFERTR